jgi:two-component system, cell cycle sensor histidine kinase and response regulator CckA
VYGIVKQSGGHVSCYSEVGKGTCFKVYLPIVVGGKSAPAPAMVVVPKTSAPIQRSSETVLLVEDEDGVRALIRQVLERDGYKVIEARNGAEALLASEQLAGKLDLLLTDVVLVHMSGRDIAIEIKSKRTDTKVLFVSGYTEEAIIRHGVLESGTAFLQKPFTPGALSRKVREILDTDTRAAAATASS